ncbi:Gfo/Idh/MocA family oxidoreductase [Pseudoflavitalea sp. X16]|uniref:Gfo/Idh/MocA family protein n=1 Tax=Paraflavitalea devenefica TaxID=2716334 RepID=UPI00141E4E19|nr:Gfo/Idh/MocA family oxidoreductase [Paraflavitalea devenefica]NII27089.1 Gfo/Idh/MocA family oxidoreductase [Paraflavitalea devenefica]
MKRRDFIKNTSLATAGITILNFPVFGKQAPSNKVVLSVMGVNSRGAYLAECFSKLPNVEIAYLCDVEEKAIQNGLKPFARADRKPTVVKDIRELVKKTDFDALVIAAPDHWHAPASILGVTHGKHVYVEKPCAHNPYEGELLVQAMNKYGKLIQMGNQRRSFPTLINAVKEVREGIIGNVYLGKGWYANNRKSIGKGNKVAVPATLDFDLWQGPAPRRDYMDNLVHYNWHWFWHWGTSETCNNGTHEIDCCRWFLGVDFPTKVTSAGGRYAFKDDWETPDTQVATFEFGPEKAITWESRSCNDYPVEGAGRGFIIYGDKGTLVNFGSDNYKIFDNNNKLIKEVKSAAKADSGNLVSSTGNLDFYHFNNFINSIRGEAKLNSPVDEGHKSVLLCLLANIAQRTGRTLHTNPANGHILGDKKAMKLWRRDYEKGWEPKV